MKHVLVLYATREGQSRKIAERVAECLRAKQYVVQLWDTAEIPAAFDLETFGGVVMVASVHRGTHERETISFVEKHREQLATMPAAFLSVSLSQAGADDPNASAEKRAQAAADARQMLERFFEKTQWQPGLAWPIAGALVYSMYGPITKFVMKRIAKSMGGPTDVSRDYEFTDWPTLDHYIDEFVSLLDARSAESGRSRDAR